MANVEQKCGGCQWFQEDTRSPQETAQLLSQISGLSVDALGNPRINITTKSGICLAAKLSKPKVTISSFSCTVIDNNGEFLFTPKDHNKVR